MPISSAPCIAHSRADSQFGSASASLLRSATYDVAVASKPWLLAAQNPLFSELTIKRSGTGKLFAISSTNWADPSTDPLSMTTTSYEGWVWQASDSKHDC